MLLTPHLGLVASFQFGLGSSWDCHLYAMRAPEGLVLIDAGCGLATSEVVSRCAAYWPKVPITDLVLTHAHPDHACGASPLAQATGCRVHAPRLSAEWLRQGDEGAIGLAETRAAGAYPAHLRLQPLASVEPYVEGSLSVAGQTFQAIAVAGHSADSHCLYTEVAGQRLLFAGDTLFYGAVFGVINRPDSGMSGYRQDLGKLAQFPIDALLPGHGLFTLSNGQRHVDKALEILHAGFLPRQVGQFDLLF